MSNKPAALITGASAGLGAEYARLFAQDGHALVLVARRKDRLDALAAELKGAHDIDVHVVDVDLMDPAGPGSVVERVEAAGVFVGYLVNNAGFGTNGLFIESPLEKELGQIKLNISALVELTHRFLPPMLEKKAGAVLNIGSTAGFQPGPYMAVYYATKAFVNAFSEALAEELRGSGVTVTVHCPGPTETEFASLSRSDKTALFKKGKIATAKGCAAHGYAAMRRGEALSIHGFLNRVGVFSVRLAPRGLVRGIARRLNAPPAGPAATS